MFYFLLDIYSQIKQISFVFKTIHNYVTINIFHTGLFFRNGNWTHTVYYFIVRTTEILEFEIDFNPSDESDDDD